MKNICKLLFVALLGLMVISCEKDEDMAVLVNTTEGSLTSDVNSILLDQALLNSPAVHFTWTEPAFNIPVATTHQLQFATAGFDFNKPENYALPEGTNTAALTHEQLNSIVVKNNIGLVPGTAGQVEVRLQTITGNTSFYSESITLTITPFVPNPDLIYPKINVPGSYGTAAGYADWDPGNTMNLYSPAADGKYRGFIYVSAAASEYKFTINQDWAGDKGDDGTFTGILVADGEVNIPAATAGTYYLNVDWDNNTYTTTLADFGIIGDATPTGWGSDTDFVYNPATKNWEIASIALTAGGYFKFRANDDWAIKFQPAAADEVLTSGAEVQTYMSAEGTVNGDPSYQVDVSGNYRVVLDLHNSAYYNLTLIKL